MNVEKDGHGAYSTLWRTIGARPTTVIMRKLAELNKDSRFQPIIDEDELWYEPFSCHVRESGEIVLVDEKDGMSTTLLETPDPIEFVKDIDEILKTGSYRDDL